MKVARKSLSVLLSFLMLFTSCSIALVGLDLTSAAAEGDYSALTGNEITLDGGAAMKQIQALIGALSGLEYTETSKTPAELAEEYGVEASVLSGQGMSEYPYSAKDTEAQSVDGGKYDWTAEVEYPVGSDIKADARTQYNPANPVYGTYTGSVSVDLKTYLLSHKLADVESTIDLNYEYSVETAIGKQAEITEIEWYTNQEHADKPYQHVYDSHIWQYTKTVAGEVTATNTTAKTELDKIDTFVNQDYYKNPQLLADKTPDELAAIKAQARELVDMSTASGYDSDVWDHFWGEGALDKIDAFIKSIDIIDDALLIVAAYRTLNDVKADYDELMSGKSYDTLTAEEGAQLGTIAAAMQTAYDDVVALGFNEEVYAWITANVDGLESASAEDAQAKRDAVISTDFSYRIYTARADVMTYIEENAADIRSTTDIIQANEDEYEAALSDEPGAEDPTPVITFSEATATEIAAWQTQIQSLKNALTAYEAAAPEEYAAIVSEEDVAYIDQTLTRLNTAKGQVSTLVTAAGAEEQYQSYFEDVGADLWTDMAAYSNSQAVDRYNYLVGNGEYTNYAGDTVETVTGQITVITNSYNAFKAAAGQQLADAVFSVTYKGSHVLLQNALTTHANIVLKAELVARENAQVARVAAGKTTDGTTIPSTVNFDNFSTVDAFVASFDYELYHYVETTSYYYDKDGNLQSNPGIRKWTNNNQAALQKIAQAKNTVNNWKNNPSGFNQWHGHNSSGTYWTRYAGSYGKNTNTTIAEQRGSVSTNRTSGHGDYSADVTRDHNKNANNDYTVNTNRINDTIVKLDTFLTSKDFTDTLGLEWYTERYAEGDDIPAGKEVGDIKYQTQVSGISQYIEVLLTRKLFTNNMVNTIVALLFPMLTDLLGGLLSDLPSVASPYVVAPGWGSTQAAGMFSASALNISMLKGGGLNLYLDNKTDTISVDGSNYTAGGTPTLPQLFSSIGANIYPSTFASYLNGRNTGGKYTKIINALNSAGRNWLYFDGKDGSEKDNKVQASELGYTENGKFVPFNWSVSETSGQEYNTFVAAMGDVFGSVEKILRTLLCGQNFDSGKIGNAVYVIGELKIKPLFVTYDPDVTGYLEGLQIKINGVNVYNDVWVPVMKALGVATGTYTLPASISNKINYGSLTSGHYNFRTLSSSNESAANMVRALFEPLLVFIGQLETQPIAKLCSVLPSLLEFLSLNKLQSLLGTVNLNISATLYFNNLGDLLHGAYSAIGSVANWFIKDYTLSIPTQNLGNLVKLNEMLPFDLTNINALVKYVLNATGLGLTLPDINASKVIQAASSLPYEAFQNGTSAADTADVFFRILQYIAKVAQNKATVNSIISLIGGGKENGTTRMLRTLLDAVVTSIQKHPDDAAAALVELFSPNVSGGKSVYQMFDLDWMNTAPAGDYGEGTDINKASMVYVTAEHYGYRWTRQTAEEMANDITPLINELLRDLGGEDAAQIDTFNEILQNAIMGMFTNAGLAGVLKGLVSLGKSMTTTRDRLAGDGTTYQEETENAIAALLKREVNVDLTTWYKAFEDISGTNVLEDLDLGDLGGGIAGDADYDWTQTFNGVTIEYTVEPNENGDNYVFTYDGTAMTQGDYMTFMEVFVHLCSEFAPALGLILSGQDLSMFADALQVKGFEGYTKGLFPLFEVLGIQTIKPETYMSRANAHTVGTVAYKNDNAQLFAEIVKDVFGFIDGLLYKTVDGERVEENTLKKVLELLPKFVYLIESNAISAMLKNILMPILVLLDTLRPIIGIDIDNLVSMLLTQLLPEGGVEGEDGKYTPWNPGVFSEKYSMKKDGVVSQVDFITMVLYYAVGAWENGEGWTEVTATYDITVDDLSLHGVSNSEVAADKRGILGFLDQFLGTNLLNSALSYAMTGLTRGIKYEPGSGDKYWDVPRDADGWVDGTKTPDAADTLTILINALLETLISSGKDGKTNGVIITDWLDKYFEIRLDSDKPDSVLDLSAVFTTLQTILKSGEITGYASPDWLYMGMTGAGNLNLVHDKATNSAVYLEYKTNWSKATAETVDGTLESILNLVFNSLDDDGDGSDFLKTMIQSILNDNVYSPELFNSIIKVIYDAIANLGAAIFKLAGIVLDINAEQFLNDYGVKNADDKYEFSADKVAETFTAHGFDVTTEEGFIGAAKYLLSTLDSVLDWFLFGEQAAFFTSSEKNADGTFKYDPLITIAGGKGYEQAIVYLLEMLGMEMNVEGLDASLYSADTKIKKAEAYKDATTGKYKTSEAVGDILEAVVTKLDKVAEDPINNALDLVLNLIYFINAKGLSTIIANLLAPVDNLLRAVLPLQDSLAGITSGALAGIDLTNVLGIVKSLIPDDTKAQLSEWLGQDVDAIELHGGTPAEIRQDWDQLLNWNLVFGIVEGMLGFTVKEEIQNFIKGFYMGSLKSYTSANGKPGYRMAFNAKNADSDRADFITILVSMLLEIVVTQNADGTYANRTPIVNLIAGGVPKAPAVPGPDADEEELAAYAEKNRQYLADKAKFENEKKPQAEGIFDLILALYTGVSLTADDYGRPDWDYLAEGADATLAENEYHKDALDAWVANFTANYKSGRFAVDNTDEKYSNVYLKYVNWDKQTADEIVANASAMIDSVLEMMGQQPLAEMIKKLLSGAIYTHQQLDEDNKPVFETDEQGNQILDEQGNPIPVMVYGVINDIVEMAAIAIAKLALQLKAATGLEAETVFDALKETLGADVAAWYNKLDIVTKLDDEGNEIIDEENTKLKADAVITTEEGHFGEALAEALEPLGGVLSWLFFGGSYTFFNDSAAVPIAKLNGGFGYDYALLYILEALGVENLVPGSTYYDAVTDANGIRTVTLHENGIHDFLVMLGNAVESRVTAITDDTINTVISLLPALVYFIGSDGLTTAVSNLLKPVTALLAKAQSATGKTLIDVGEILAGTGLPLRYEGDTLYLGWDEIFDLLEGLAGIKVQDEVQAAIKGIYVGKLESKTHVSENAGEGFVTMTADTVEAKADILTILIGALGDIIKNPENKPVIAELLGGEEKYDAVMNLLDGIEVDQSKYKIPDWGYTELHYNFIENADAPELPDATNASVYLQYRNNWNDEAANLLNQRLEELINVLLKDNGGSLAGLLTNLLNDNLYSADMLVSLVGMVYDLIGQLDVHLVEVVGALLAGGIQDWLQAFGNYVPADPDVADSVDKWVFDETKAKAQFGDVDKTNFGDKLYMVISPLNELLAFLLQSGEYTFFDSYQIDETTGKNKALLTIKGGDGYTHGLAYLLEALGCKNLPKTIDALDTDVFIKAILNSVVARLNDLATDDANGTSLDKILELIPEIIYFINTKALGTMVDNLIYPLNTLVGAVAPIVGENISIISLLGDTLKGLLGEEFDVSTATDGFRGLLTFENVLKILENKVGLFFKPADVELLENFYIGKLTKIADTVATEPSYRMGYSGGAVATGNRVDMITIVLSLLLDTVEYDKNKPFIMGLLAGEEPAVPVAPTEPGTNATPEELAQYQEDLEAYNTAVEEYPAKKEAYDAKYAKALKTYDAILSLYKSTDTAEYIQPDWDYLAGEQNYMDRLQDYVDQYNTVIAANRESCVFLQYGNDWGDKDNIENLAASLDGLVEFVMETAFDNGSIWALIQGLLEDNVYTQYKTDNEGNVVYEKDESDQFILDENGDKIPVVESNGVINDLVEVIALNLKKFESYLGIIDVVLGTDVESYLDLCNYYDADGNVIDFEAEDIPEIASAKVKKLIVTTNEEEFADEIEKILQPVAKLLDWFLFSGNMTFFYDAADAQDQIYLKGGAGYDQALVYLVEALGIEITNEEITDPETGNRTAPLAIKQIILKLVDRVKGITEEPIKGLGGLIPNLMYFLGANGLGTMLTNILAPVNGILGVVNSFMDEDKQISIEGLAEQYLGTTLDVSNINLDALFDIIYNSLGITVPEASAKAIKEVLIGTLQTAESANGTTTVTLKADTPEDLADFVTLLLSIAGDIVKYEDNKAAFVKLLGDDADAEAKYNAIISILDADTQASYEAPDWGYMDEGYAYTIEDLDNPAVPAYPADQILYNYYNKYWKDRQNNWNEETAEYIVNNLTDIANAALNKFIEDENANELAEIVKNLINDKVYSEDNFRAVLKSIYNAVAGLDARILTPVGLLFNADIVNWLETYGSYDAAEGKYVFNDDKTFAVANATEFEDTIVEVLAPLSRLVEWLFLSKDFEFLYDSDASTMLTIKGGEGYANALVYLLEMLGVTGLKNRAEIDNAEDMLRSVVSRLLARVDEITADPANELIALLPNIIYFINTNGLGAVIDNLIAPLDALVVTAAPFADTLNGGVVGLLKSMLASDDPEDTMTKVITALDIQDGDKFIDLLTMEKVLAVVKELTGIEVPADTALVLTNFYIGKLEAIDSANNHTGFRMVYADTQVDPAVMLTVLVGIIADIARVPENQAALKELLGDNGKYIDAVANILDLANAVIDYTRFKWLYIMTGEGYTEGDVVSAAGNSTKYSDPYADQDYWTPEMAQEVANHLDRFVGNILCLLGLELNGKAVDSLDEIITQALNEYVYTQSNIDAITALLKDKVIANLKAALGDELYAHVVEIVKSALDVDLDAYANMEIEVEVTDQASFKAALDQILAPILPLLNVVLCGQSISFFYYNDGTDVITIPGAEGYKFSIIPLLEGLTCEQGDIADVETFKAAMTAACAKDATTAQKYAVINMVLDPIFNKLEAIKANPIDEIKAMLPAVIYFINSEGLNTVFQNIVASLDAVLAAVEPITGEKLTVQKLAFKEDEALKDYNFAYLMNLLLSKMNNKLGTTLGPVITDFVNELTTGVIKKYDSKNGDTTFQDYYTMIYATNGTGESGIEGTTADMITVVLRILIDFVTDANNIAQIKELLKDYIPNETTYKYVCTFLDSLRNIRTGDKSFARSLYFVYQAYIGVEKAVDAVDIAKHDANNTWAFVFKMMESSHDPALNKMYEVVTKFFNTYFKDIISTDVGPDREGEPGVLAPNGFIKFFKAIADFFKKIADFFKQLFGG